MVGFSPRKFAQQPGRQTSYQGPSLVRCGRSAMLLAAVRSQIEVDEPGDELAVRAGRGDADGGEAQPGAGLERLGVEVPDDFHVVADEAERHDHDALDALAGEFLDGVVDVGFEPRHVRGAGAGLVDEGPGGVSPVAASTRRMTSVPDARCCATTR